METFTFRSSPMYSTKETPSSLLMATQHVGKLPNWVVYLLSAIMYYRLLNLPSRDSETWSWKSFDWICIMAYGVDCARYVCRSLGALCSCGHYSCRSCCVALFVMCVKVGVVNGTRKMLSWTMWVCSEEHTFAKLFEELSHSPGNSAWSQTSEIRTWVSLIVPHQVIKYRPPFLTFPPELHITIACRVESQLCTVYC